VNSIWGSGSLFAQPGSHSECNQWAVQTSAGAKTLVKVDSHGVGAHGYDPVAFVMEGEPVKQKFPQTLTAEAFIEGRTNDENNWTIGYCSDDAGAIGMLALFCSSLICVYMSRKRQQNVINLFEPKAGT
jgi:hypothetical protein